MSLQTVYTGLVGVTFGDRQMVIERCHLHQLLMLRREPDNAYDPNAVAVFARFSGDEFQIGYLPALLAADLAEFMPDEVRGQITDISGHWEREDGTCVSLVVGIVFRIEVGGCDASFSGV
jgi:hypothetical protein